ncbi:hypothetical protein ACVJGD_008753 [Bradyrhizobium sp. USDA 10063]
MKGVEAAWRIAVEPRSVRQLERKRRQLVVVFCDVVGSTHFAESYTKKICEICDYHFRRCAKFSAMKVKSIFHWRWGDGLFSVVRGRLARRAPWSTSWSDFGAQSIWFDSVRCSASRNSYKFRGRSSDLGLRSAERLAAPLSTACLREAVQLRSMSTAKMIVPTIRTRTTPASEARRYARTRLDLAVAQLISVRMTR